MDETFEPTADLNAALAKAQAQMKPAAFNRVNPHFKTRYADLAAVIAAVREPFASNGLAFTQTMYVSERGPVLLTTLRHASGQCLNSEYPLPERVKPQEFGAALTYARRYSLSCIAGIAADEDDDGNGANTISNGNGQKRENPHQTTPADLRERDLQYAADGTPVDNIPLGDPGVERMSKAMSRKDCELAGFEMRKTKTEKELFAWANANANRVASWPRDWEEIFRGKFDEHLLELRARDDGIPEFLDRRSELVK